MGVSLYSVAFGSVSAHLQEARRRKDIYWSKKRTLTLFAAQTKLAPEEFRRLDCVLESKYKEGVDFAVNIDGHARLHNL